mmetsp:Transcript_23408/g.67448  ORF Transcript_23408/g.67448 Transcript_23408/m.67448 type:complete len:206 (+) Transcript_23408:642-1259(+)
MNQTSVHRSYLSQSPRAVTPLRRYIKSLYIVPSSPNRRIGSVRRTCLHAGVHPTQPPMFQDRHRVRQTYPPSHRPRRRPDCRVDWDQSICHASRSIRPSILRADWRRLRRHWQWGFYGYWSPPSWSHQRHRRHPRYRSQMIAPDDERYPTRECALLMQRTTTADERPMLKFSSWRTCLCYSVLFFKTSPSLQSAISIGYSAYWPQ